MKREMTLAAIAIASAVAALARCASGGVATVGHGIVSDSVLEMLFCRPLADCGAKKHSAISGKKEAT